MNSTPAPDALFCLSTLCPHCPAMLQTLSGMVKRGQLGRLEIVNLDHRPELAGEWGVRSVPWLRIGPFELTGLRRLDEIQALIKRAVSPTGLADYFHDRLREGELETVLAMVGRRPSSLGELLPVVANPEASINVRIGAGVVFEEFAGQPAMKALTGRLGELAGHADARVRADACHYLSLTADEAARPYLAGRLQDDDGVVREIAEESLESLGSLAAGTGSAGQVAG